jgi:RNA polymerase sigma-70 factor (ECF subfamily)
MPQAILPEPCDATLALRARDDREAFGVLYERHFDGIYAYLRYRVNDRSTADDLAAVVFTRALDRLDGYDPERAPFGVWLLVIARNALRDHYRRRARWRWLPLEVVKERVADGAAPDAGLERQERRDVLLAAVARLDDRERDLLGLKFGAGRSHRDIAALTGLSESNVGVIVHRALGRLRRVLDREEVRHD